MKNPRTKFEQMEGSITSTPEVTKAEQEFFSLYQRVKSLNDELAEELDIAVGQLARAYELMGFICAEDGKEVTA